MAIEKKLVGFPKDGLSVEVDVGDNLLDIIRKLGLPITADCGGVGQCGKCLVEINGKRRLACKCNITEDIEVVICDSASSKDYDILTDTSLADDAQISDLSSSRFGIAIDIGTTTIAGRLLELNSGNNLASFAELNNQISYGADVISRITASLDDASLLSGLITAQLDRAVIEMIGDAGVDASQVERMVIAGNTVMTYLLLKRPCRALGFNPFKPDFYYEKSYPYAEVFHTNTLDAQVYILPFMSAYVGGDITSGICAVGEEQDDYMLMDMGTNGELAFHLKGRVICTASAAGPAFEGGCIECGSGSTKGAITKVRRTEAGDLELLTIGGVEPRSICGSGLLDLIALLVREGAIDESGRLDDSYENQRVQLSPRVYVSQKDIRQFQLAKGAVRSGFEILMREMGDVSPAKVFLAGGFGQNLDVNSAATVGLLPKRLVDSTISIGNSSLSGAVKICLNPSLMDTIMDTVLDVTEINLGIHKDFNNEFVNNMAFE